MQKVSTTEWVPHGTVDSLFALHPVAPGLNPGSAIPRFFHNWLGNGQYRDWTHLVQQGILQLQLVSSDGLSWELKNKHH